MRYHLVTANTLDKTDRVSPRFIWMSSKETDEFDQRPETFIEGGGTSLKGGGRGVPEIRSGAGEDAAVPHRHQDVHRSGERVLGACRATPGGLLLQSAQGSGQLEGGGHAVAVVGYQANGRFILRNSWGSA
ncbi:hypothetical protein ACWDYH_34505 [Nocardia goodfellowii]